MIYEVEIMIIWIFKNYVHIFEACTVYEQWPDFQPNNLALETPLSLWYGFYASIDVLCDGWDDGLVLATAYSTAICRIFWW